jgi:hypothetical protein
MPVRCPTDEAWNREQDARLAKENGERQARIDAATAKRDRNDVIAQVLNYTSTGVDEGSDGDFWYRPDPTKPCVYRRMSEGPNFMSMVTLGLNLMTNGGWLDLNALDPQTIGIEDRYVGGLLLTTVLHDATPILISSGQLDHARLARGWALIYRDGHCNGLKRAF